MRILQLHADWFDYEPVKKEIESAQQVKQEGKVHLEDLVVAFVSVEKGDGEQEAAKAAQAVADSASNLKAQRILIYPYAHLSGDLASSAEAIPLLSSVADGLREKGFEVHESPFGWTKGFDIKVKGHAMAEQFKLIKAELAVERQGVPKAVAAEEKLRSYWYVLTPEGELVPAKEYDYGGREKLRKLADYEMAKSRAVTQVPPHVLLMQRLAIADYEEGSDVGNMRWYPKGRMIKSLLESYVTAKVQAYGGVEVETPIMYDMHHPALESYLNRFPARQYIVKSDDRELFLRFAACFGQFLMAKDARISYKHLPLKLYELTRYSFRREKSGEVVGLRRLRAFTMPDCHALVKDFEMAKSEMSVRLDLCLDTLGGAGILPDDVEMAIRFTKDFYEKNKEFVVSLVKKMGKPVLAEMWDERFFYFVLKYELNFIDNLDKASALSTDQIDVENAERYGIYYVDEDGSKKHPIILHCSPSGAIERLVYALLEKAAAVQAKGEVPDLPLWLTPTQVRVIPLSSDFASFAATAADRLEASSIRVDIDDRDETVGKKIRDAEREWVRYILVLGSREASGGRLQVRDRRMGKMREMTLEELAVDVQKEVAGKPFRPLPLPRQVSLRAAFSPKEGS
ncbi:MAG: threonine--tRNA ligase [Conexivisphaerales archaeon]